VTNGPRFPILVGPTAGGKSTLAVEVAFALGGPSHAEIVTADAYQIYRGLDIGTAKPTAEEQRGISHHLIDIVDPGERFTVHDWLRAAERAIDDIRSRGRMPIVVGGTHLYIKSFLDGMFEGPGASEEIRAELRVLSPSELRSELERVDPAAATKLHPNDLRRTIRALEVFRLTGTPISAHQHQWDREDRARKDCVLVGLDWPAEMLNPRINARVKDMISRGLVEEARGLWQRGALEGNQTAEALGYKQLIGHFRRRCSLEDAIEEIKVETRRFAKNQRTWLKRLRTTAGSVWIDAATQPARGWAEIVTKWVRREVG